MGSSMNRRFDTTRPVRMEPKPLSPQTPFRKARRDSTRPPTSEDFTVPLRWSMWIGFLAGLFVMALYLLCCKLGLAFDIGWLALLFFLAFASVCLLESNWFKQQLWVGGKVLKVAERITGWDINQDGVVGELPPQPSFLIEQVDKKQGGAHIDRVQPVGPLDAFATFAFAALNGQSMAMDAWAGKYKPWSRGDYITNREKLIALGWIRWVDSKNKSLGLELTDDGREGFPQWLQQYARTHAHATGDVQVISPPAKGSGVIPQVDVEREVG